MAEAEPLRVGIALSEISQGKTLGLSVWFLISLLKQCLIENVFIVCNVML